MTDTDDIVRDGDRVAGQSLVLALPGRPVQFCGPPMGTGRTAPDLPAGPQRVPEPCPNALTVTGIHLDRLTHRKAVGDAIWGWAGVEGIELNGPYVTYPYGWHLQDTSNRKGTEVNVVTTTGDVAAARRLLDAVFPAEHLCIRTSTWSAAQMDAAMHELRTSAEATRLHVEPGHRDVSNDRVTAKVLIVVEPVARFVAGIAGGRIVPVPVLRKVT